MCLWTCDYVGEKFSSTNGVSGWWTGAGYTRGQASHLPFSSPLAPVEVVWLKEQISGKYIILYVFRLAHGRGLLAKQEWSVEWV